MQPQNPEPKIGFTRFAELWNGRLAMVGFLTAVAVEMATGQGILGQLGIM
ncbi:MAG: chlorophyll a/b-binding protein [Pleurocapsa sp.]